jgi:hypothetical protein
MRERSRCFGGRWRLTRKRWADCPAPTTRLNSNASSFLEKKIQSKDEVLAEMMAEHLALKIKSWGASIGGWVPPNVRDQIVDFVRRWSEKTEIGVGRFIAWLREHCQSLIDKRSTGV